MEKSMHPDFTFVRRGNKNEETMVLKQWKIKGKTMYLHVFGPPEERDILANLWSEDDENPDFEDLKNRYIKDLEKEFTKKITRLRKVSAIKM